MKKSNIINKLIYITFILVIASLSYSYSEPVLTQGTSPSFETLTRDSGLSNMSVSSIIQDKYGFFWFGTQGGLNYYDGRKMKVYRNNPFQENGLIHNLIQTMYYDKEKHEIWIGTYQGISRFAIKEKNFKNYKVEEEGLSNPVIVAITKDVDGNIWAGTMEGLNKIDPKTGSISNYEIPGKVVRSLKISTENKLLIGTYKGLYYYDDKKDDIQKIELDLPSQYVMTINEYENGIITLGLWDGGLAKVNLATKDVKIISFKDNRVYSTIKTSDGIEWVGTWGGGLYAIDNRGKIYNYTVQKNKNSLPHPIVYSMYQDHTDILWVGTNGGGVSKINPRKRNYVQFSNDPEDPYSLSAGKINAIFRDSRGNLWISVYNLGLDRYDPNQKRMLKYRHDPENPNSISENRVTDILETSDGKLLIGNGKGISYYEYDEDKFVSMEVLPEDSFVYTMDESNNSELWLGTYTNGVYYYNRKTGDLKNYNHSKKGKNYLSDNLIYDVLVDSKDRVWIATNNGLNLLKSGKESFTIYHKNPINKNGLGSNVMKVLFEDSKGKIWIGMNGGGVAVYNEKGSFKTFTEKDGLSSNTVVGILEGSDGRIWVSTQDGISIINPDNQNIYILKPDDGIGGWEFNSGHFLDNNGDLLFGGVHGITRIPSTFTDGNIPPPRLYIKDVKLYQESIDLKKSFFNDEYLKFKPNDNFLEFKFVALDFDDPEKIKFSYILEGFDSEWVNLGNRDYISYSNLPAGSYTLKVQAQTARGVKSSIEQLSFDIDKPWFKTNLAYFSYIILFILLIYILFKIKEGKLINEKNRELSSLNKKLKTVNKELEEHSIKDQLTGIYNRRYFNTRIDEFFKLAKRSKTNLSFLMIDIDKFKEINDTYGHLIGDKYLVGISDIISNQLARSTDFVARYGGDEFVVVLYDTDEKGSKKIAKDIREAVEKYYTSVKLEGNFEDIRIKTTVSIGITSQSPEKDTNIKDMLKIADESLYCAKKDGRNKICMISDNTYKESNEK
ncbi:MAG: ligand-binding sensor domain-containing protein [Fusobacteriota bacterium]